MPIPAPNVFHGNKEVRNPSYQSATPLSFLLYLFSSLNRLGRRRSRSTSQRLLPRVLRQKLSIPALLVVDSTLGLVLALPTSGTLVFTRGDGAGRVPVADGLVALVEQFVVGHVVLVDVGLDLLEAPVDERVDLDDAALLVQLDDGDGPACASLGAAAASEDGGHLQVLVGPLLRLDLGDPVV